MWLNETRSKCELFVFLGNVDGAEHPAPEREHLAVVLAAMLREVTVMDMVCAGLITMRLRVRPQDSHICERQR
jgi:hypothetical protein